MDIEPKIVLILAFLAEASGWRPFTVEMRNISYELVRPEIVDLNVTINKNAFDANINILRDMSQPFVDLEVVHDLDMVYFNKTVDICSFLNNRKSNILVDIIYRILSDHAEMPKRCPVRRKLYKLVNVIIDTEKFPPLLPDHKARVSAVAWNKVNGKKSIFLKASIVMVVERSFKSNG